MANYQRNVFSSGAWAVKSDLFDKRVKKAKIVSETNPEPTSFKNEKGELQTQDVCKVLFQGEKEPLKLALNRATINALVEAFGEDSKSWMAHMLSVEIEKLPGKKFPIFLIPEGFIRTEDVNGYSVVIKDDGTLNNIPVVETIQIDDQSVDESPF